MSCEEPDCDTPARARGLCRKHYNRSWYKANPRPKKGTPKRTKRLTCQHLDCQQQPRLRFTWPQPIQRQEIACADHGEALMGSFIQGITVEDI